MVASTRATYCHRAKKEEKSIARIPPFSFFFLLFLFVFLYSLSVSFSLGAPQVAQYSTTPTVGLSGLLLSPALSPAGGCRSGPS